MRHNKASILFALGMATLPLAGTAEAATSYSISYSLCSGVGSFDYDDAGKIITSFTSTFSSTICPVLGSTFTSPGGLSFDPLSLELSGPTSYYDFTNKLFLLEFDFYNVFVITAGTAEGEGTYYITAAPAVPVPPALPLLAAGLAAMGFLGWRRKRKLAQAHA